MWFRLTPVSIFATSDPSPPLARTSCKELTDIILPEGLLEIGESAFYKCNLLAAVTLPQTLEKIGDGAFKE